jgi:hypothetical protein
MSIESGEVGRCALANVAKTRVLGSICLLLLSLPTLGGCGILGLCNDNNCPKGWVHESFFCSSNDCAQVSRPGPVVVGPPPPAAFWIKRRYFCSAGNECDVTKLDYGSCAGVLADFNADGFDHCQMCNSVTDFNNHETGHTDLSGGPCIAELNHNPSHDYASSERNYTPVPLSIFSAYQQNLKLVALNTS